jgi:3-deoxy-D-manno-octulosonate 8-phosphate phosphatase (KDO 8-P phosphatase)
MQINNSVRPEEFHRLAADIQVLLMDVDGVLTDGRLFFFPGPDGKIVESKAFDSQDGIALRWLTWYGIQTGVISGRDSPATLERAQQVGMKWVFQGHIEKIPLFEKIMSEANVSSQQVAYVGDDLTDVVIMRRVGLSFAPANARAEVKGAASAVTAAYGGSGAVREVIESLLRARGLWDEVLKKYEVEA